MVSRAIVKLFRRARMSLVLKMIRFVCPLLCVYASHLGAGDTIAQRSAALPHHASALPQTVELVPGVPAGVVSVVHRIGGWRLLTLLERDELHPPAAANRFVHTNIVAGYTTDDRRFVVVRLPQGEVEALAGEMPPEISRERLDDPPDSPVLVIVDGDRTMRPARFVGLDAGTGLSLLEHIEKIDSAAVASRRFVRAKSVPATGATVLLFAPEAAMMRASEGAGLRLRITEKRARLVKILNPTGGFSARLIEPAADGGRSLHGAVVTDDQGRLLGVVGDVTDGLARVIAGREIDAAVDRLLRRRASVAQPWFGARGQDLAATAPDELHAHGWTLQAARGLLATKRGVLLTNVPPYTPAALAGLRAGDVVVGIDNAEVPDAKDFSGRLAAAGIGAVVRLTIVRADSEPGERADIVVRLSESLDARRDTDRAVRLSQMDDSVATLLLPLGLETVTAPADLRARLKAADGLLVVALRQGSVAAVAGIRPGDIIEQANGKPLTATDARDILRSALRREVSLDILRGDQRIRITLKYLPAAK